LSTKRIGITSLIFQGHVTSLVMGHVTIYMLHRPFPIGGPLMQPSLYP